MPRKYPAALRRQLIELARSGTKVAQLAATFEMSDATIYNWLKRRGTGAVRCSRSSRIPGMEPRAFAGEPVVSGSSTPTARVGLPPDSMKIAWALAWLSVSRAIGDRLPGGGRIIRLGSVHADLHSLWRRALRGGPGGLGHGPRPDRRRHRREGAALRGDPDRRRQDAPQRRRGADRHRGQDEGRARAVVTLDRDPRIVSGSDYGNPDPEWRRIDWRRHRHSVELPGASVNYVEIGEGEPILFVHGLSGCWQNWLENLPHIGAGRRAIALDLPGFGSSPMPSWEIEMPAYGRLIDDFCERLGLEKVALVGNSMGGFIAVEAVMAAAPGRFERLVLVSAAGILNTWNPEERATARRGPDARAGARRRPLPGLRPGAGGADSARHPRGGDQLSPPPPPLAPGDLRAHRPPATARATAALQPGAGGVPR
ncbi:MAG: alpha/beta fold hydrolase [Solirubrobacterales bacterium]|nr:alpha/beta fold hydrolase [Solirubrobacterales bacterium]